MASGLTQLCSDTQPNLSYLNKLETIYAAMDRRYEEVADAYEFKCTGCRDSCCLTLFHHHTLIEFLYLARGLQSLEVQRLATIEQKAVQVKRYISQAKELPIRVMCPLNEEGRCVSYPYRPMICRLHGIPHELRKPGQALAHGSGCHIFSEKYQHKPYQPFDRTPHYLQMAHLEKALRIEVGYYQRLKMTVADMVLAVQGND
jgi:Fe-S-cluster containining protein